MSEKYWSLKSCDLFRHLPDDEIARLEACSHVKSFPRKCPIYLPADPGESVYLLLSGRAKICHLTSEGKQSILAFIEPGEFFGELAILDDDQRDEYAETVESSSVMKIPAREIRSLMERRSSVSTGVTKIIGMRRRRIERRLKNLLFQSNRERLTHLLLELMEQYGETDARGSVRLRIKLSHQDLANVIGSTRETVTVVLGDLQSAGLIEVGRRRITIIEPDRLAQGVDHVPARSSKSDGPRPADGASASKFGQHR